MQVVKHIWAYIKKHDLQNPAVSCGHAILCHDCAANQTKPYCAAIAANVEEQPSSMSRVAQDKRKIILDDKLSTLFTPPINIFSMNKQLSKHVFAAGIRRSWSPAAGRTLPACHCSRCTGLQLLVAGASAGAGESARISQTAVKGETQDELEGVQAAKPTARRPASKSEGKVKAAVKRERANLEEEGDEGSEDVVPKKRKANGFTKQITCVCQPSSERMTVSNA